VSKDKDLFNGKNENGGNVLNDEPSDEVIDVGDGQPDDTETAADKGAHSDSGEPDALDDFEETFERLKEISDELEREDVKLGEMVKLFEEGVELIKQCDAYLREARARVGKYIERDDDGRWVIKGLADDE